MDNPLVDLLNESELENPEEEEDPRGSSGVQVDLPVWTPYWAFSYNEDNMPMLIPLEPPDMASHVTPLLHKGALHVASLLLEALQLTANLPIGAPLLATASLAISCHFLLQKEEVEEASNASGCCPT